MATRVDMALKEAEKVLRGDSRVVLVYLFGSTARGSQGPLSDVDVAVLLQRKLSWDEERELRADVGEAAPGVDLVLLNDAPPVLRREVIVGGTLLFSRSPHRQVEFEITALSRCMDMQPIRRVQDGYLRARLKERRGTPDRSAA
jgi:predicted nucleotidyltransferase